MKSVVPISKKITEGQIISLANAYGIDPYYLQAFTEVEGSGIGFSDYTGKMLIQFEPSYMRRMVKERGAWVNNPVGNQTVEYAAFENAAHTDKEAAMRSCSIGMMQVMGDHYKMMGFDTVQSMWDFADKSELNQVHLGVKFIKSNRVLYQAVKEKDSATAAYYYNGAYYKEIAEKNHQVPYDKRIDNAYLRLSAGSNIHKTTTTVNIRKGPGIEFEKVTEPMRVNTLLTIVDTKADWTLVSVVATGVTGWVSSQYIK